MQHCTLLVPIFLLRLKLYFSIRRNHRSLLCLLLFTVSKETVTNKPDKNLKTHSRQEDKFLNFGVTPTFRSYIAKKLSEILER
jgi:hypothetical protein